MGLGHSPGPSWVSPPLCFRTGPAPLLREGLEVVLEPEGVRIGGRFYPKEAFRGLEEPQCKPLPVGTRIPLQPFASTKGYPCPWASQGGTRSWGT